MPSLDMRISEVVVYVDRAKITRRGVIAVEPGALVLDIPGLPGKLNPDSLRAAAHGTARARLLGVQAQRQHPLEAPQETVRNLEKALEEIKDQQRVLEDRIELSSHNRSALVKLLAETQTFATAIASGELPVEKSLATLDALQARAGQLDSEIQALLVDKRLLERREQQLVTELEKYRTVPKRVLLNARIDLEVLSAGELAIELSYILPEASWKPLYDLRFSTLNEKSVVEIAYLGQVIQHSGEDWSEVNLTLSTARPALAGRVPELKPWILHPRPPLVHADMPAPMSVRKARPAQVEEENLMAAKAAPVEELVAQVETAGTALVYRIQQTVSIPADGSPQKVIVANIDLEPEIDYVSAPRLVQAVYRRAKIRNESAYTLLPGVINLFDNDEFLGATRLELVPPQGHLELYLGVEDRLGVGREAKRLEVDKRLIGNRRKVTSGFTVELENHLTYRSKITLQDQLPVAGHEEIKVRLEASDPRPTRQSEMNILDWELELEPGEKRVVRFDYSVEYPQNMDLPGIP